MTIFGMLRVKNEARWIREVLQSIMPLCSWLFVLDDHSEDGTPEFCRMVGENVTVMRSPFQGLDESRDKDYLLDRIMGCVPDDVLLGDRESPYWVLAIDGDEVLASGGQDAIAAALRSTTHHAFRLPITYLWNGRKQKRVDGVYNAFARPSIFRLMNKAFRFQRTPWGGNFHCSSIPQELLHHSQHAHNLIEGAPLLHLGYLHREDRVRKYEWYNRIDPNNPVEDCYRHIVQGDVPEVTADMKLLHAGPLRLEAIA